MPGLDLIQFLANALYVGIFLLASVRAIRRPRLADIEIAMLFGTAALVVAESWVFAVLNATPPILANDIAGALILALPYILVRLVDEFAGVPAVVLRVCEAALILSVAALFYFAAPAPAAVTLFQVLYFVALTLFVTATFAHAARTSMGSTAKRLGSVAIGSSFLALDIFLAGIAAVVPAATGVVQIAGALTGLASGIAYYLGFVTPAWLVRSWREPAFIAFLDRADKVAEQRDLPALLHELHEAVSAGLGLPDSIAAVWNEQDRVLESLPNPGLTREKSRRRCPALRCGKVWSARPLAPAWWATVSAASDRSISTRSRARTQNEARSMTPSACERCSWRPSVWAMSVSASSGRTHRGRGCSPTIAWTACG
jgi:hypothetical protein